MKLENFVNAMGINVIQVIKNIQSNNGEGSKDSSINNNNNNNNNDEGKSIIIDANAFIDSEWYEKRLEQNYEPGDSGTFKCAGYNGTCRLSGLSGHQMRRSPQMKRVLSDNDEHSFNETDLRELSPPFLAGENGVKLCTPSSYPFTSNEMEAANEVKLHTPSSDNEFEKNGSRNTDTRGHNDNAHHELKNNIREITNTRGDKRNAHYEGDEGESCSKKDNECFPKYEVYCSPPKYASSFAKFPFLSTLDCDPNVLYRPLTAPLNFTSLSNLDKSSKRRRDKMLHRTKDVLRRRVWKRPKPVKWCSAKEFLSRKIKTYQDACELVSRSDVVVRTVNSRINDEELKYRTEYISLDDLYNKRTIDFVTPLYI